jgi:uncharacterized protein
VKHSPSDNSYLTSRVLKFNVGFLLAEGPGYSRTAPLEIPQRLRIAEDLTVEYLQGDLRLTRTSEGILLQGLVETHLLDQCSRCLTPLDVVLPLSLEELFGTPSHPTTQFLIGDDNILDLAPLLREEIFLHAPTKLYCREDCKGLCPHCGMNWNESSCTCADTMIDQRWAALLKLQPLSDDTKA